MRNLLPIGRFSEMCRLSIPALRHYDELGLLPPAAVDPDTGYRYYSTAQAIDAERIRTLRFLEMPLPEIRALLAGDPGRTRSLLEGHRRRLAEQAERQRYAITLLDSMLRDDPPAAYEIHLRETVPQLAAAIRGRAAWAELGPFVEASLMDVFRVAGDQGVRFAGPAYAIYHHADSSEAEVELEVGMPVAEQVEAAGRVVAITVPGGLVAATVHRGRYEDIGPAYRALAEWIADHGHETAGPPREMYLVGPDQVQDPGALRTEIAWPVR
jgi:effector-binding domain-containing protein/DNA-binding transcriptional MerR regulator